MLLKNPEQISVYQHQVHIHYEAEVPFVQWLPQHDHAGGELLISWQPTDQVQCSFTPVSSIVFMTRLAV